MNLEQLCKGIHLQQELQTEAVRYSQTEEFQKIRPLADGLKRMDTEAETRKTLRQLFVTDNRHMKMLTCMLACAADLYSWYMDRGISERVFWDTMGCFPRFIEECREKTGEYAFDREWWTARQISGSLFRLGALEYEMKQTEGRPVLSVHIPSDACLDKESCGESVSSARKFFDTYFPEYQDAEFVCNSWLLSPELKKLLPENSHILDFQRRFEIQKTDESDEEYIIWVFKTKNCRLADLPENTALQKNMKQHLLHGGKIGSGYGVMKKTMTDTGIRAAGKPGEFTGDDSEIKKQNTDFTIDYYNRNTEAFIERTKSMDMSFCQNKFLQRLKPGSLVLDAGCGSGRDSRVFLEYGLRVQAVDASEKMCQAASEYLGMPVKCMRFDEIDDTGKYDGIWACASLLHVEKNVLPAILRKFHRALKKDGILYASFKYGDVQEVRLERLFSDYHKEELEELFLKDGLFALEESFESQDVRPDYKNKPWVNMIVRKK